MRGSLRIGFACLAFAALIAAGSATASPLNPLERLGREIFFDRISSPDNQSCAACHAPQTGFTGAIGGLNVNGSVYRGAVPQRFGNRKPPSAAYATQAPLFHYDPVEELFVGGNFWDGRATGHNLGNPAADQALGPFLNPVEQNNPDRLSVLRQIASSKYSGFWEEAWGGPLLFGTPAEIEMNYNRVGLAVAAYEASSEVNAFSSKWDHFMNGEAELTGQEMLGMNLFNGKAMCSACHPAPLFTDYTYDNLGTPRNPRNPFYDMDEVYLDNGEPINPLGDAWVDYGLGGYLATLPDQYFTDLGLDKQQTVMENLGKFKVPTLRNVDRRPGNYFPKAFSHNGVFTSLREIVRFYNTRDVADWPEPEVAVNVNEDELGNLGLTDEEVDAVVAFMGTLSDGYRNRPPQRVTASGWTAGASGEILYRMPSAGAADVRVFDVAGREVRHIGRVPFEEGMNALEWDRRDNGGSRVGNGVYFVRIMSPEQEVTVKAIVAR